MSQEKNSVFFTTQAAGSSTIIYEALHATALSLLFLRLIYKKAHKCEKLRLQSAVIVMDCIGY